MVYEEDAKEMLCGLGNKVQEDCELTSDLAACLGPLALKPFVYTRSRSFRC